MTNLILENISLISRSSLADAQAGLEALIDLGTARVGHLMVENERDAADLAVDAVLGGRLAMRILHQLQDEFDRATA